MGHCNQSLLPTSAWQKKQERLNYVFVKTLPNLQNQKKHTETRHCSFAEPHRSISSPVFLSRDHINAAYLLFCFPLRLEYLGWYPTTCRQVNDSGISQLKNCWRSCNRMGRPGLSMVLLVLKPLKGPDLKPCCHLMVAEAPQRAWGEKLRVCDIPVSAITCPHSHSPYSPGISRAEHTAFEHSILSALKSRSMAKQLARHFQNVHINFAVANLLGDKL